MLDKKRMNQDSNGVSSDRSVRPKNLKNGKK